MTVSKKLSIVQLIMIGASISLSSIILWRAFGSSDFSISDILGFGALGILSWLLSLGVLGVAIAQIVLKVKEQTSTIYLAAGICGIAKMIPFVGYLAIIAALALNIIGICEQDTSILKNDVDKRMSKSGHIHLAKSMLDNPSYNEPNRYYGLFDTRFLNEKLFGWKQGTSLWNKYPDNESDLAEIAEVVRRMVELKKGRTIIAVMPGASHLTAHMVGKVEQGKINIYFWDTDHAESEIDKAKFR